MALVILDNNRSVARQIGRIMHGKDRNEQKKATVQRLLTSKPFTRNPKI